MPLGIETRIMKKSRITIEFLLEVFVAAAPLALFVPALVKGKTLFWGTPVMQFIPWKYLAFESLRAGILPLWNPFNGMGAPLLANYQLAFFYPPNWLGYLFATVGGIAWMAWGETLVMALHLSWAAIGMMAFQKKLGVNLTGRLVSGLAFGMCGYLVARVGFFSIVIASTWLPWMMLAVTSMANRVKNAARDNRKTIKPIMFVSLCTAMLLLSGHAQVTFYTLILASAWIILISLRRGGVKGFFWVLPLFTASLLIAVTIAAVQLLPTLEYLLDSQRSAHVDYSIAMVYSFWPWRFLTLIFPNFFGSPGMANYWGYANFWEDAVYIGILPLVAAVSTLALILSRSNKKNRDEKYAAAVFFWIVIIIGFLLALGWNTPIFPFLYRHVPTFDMFNGPARFLIWVEFALAVLAGIGVEKWKRPEGRALRWTRLSVAASAAVSVGAALSYFSLKGVNATFIPAAFLGGILGALTVFLFLKLPRQDDEKNMRLWQAALALLVSADLIAAGWTMNAFIIKDFYRISGADKNLLVLQADQRVFLAEESEYRIKFDRFFTFKSHFIEEDWDNLWTVNLPDTNILTGVQMVNNFDPLLPSRFVRLIGYLESLEGDALRRVLQKLSVTALETAGRDDPKMITFTAIAPHDRYRLYPCAEVVSESEQSWLRFISNTMDEQEASDFPLIIESKEPVEFIPCRDNVEGGVRIISLQPTETILEVETAEGAWLEAGDAWYPGWTVQIDGEPAKIFPSSFIFKSVYVPAGRRVVAFEYRPMSFIAGGVISVFGLLAAAVILYLSRPIRRMSKIDQT